MQRKPRNCTTDQFLSPEATDTSNQNAGLRLRVSVQSLLSEAVSEELVEPDGGCGIRHLRCLEDWDHCALVWQA
ncbi:hypothetical protein NDU88_009661 [Pleurodeles waltl]|uniref:Uncharacterized protein n=1 Tax=Pleurodeles waltl TaxID=8319 RepID=A0AAV7RY78_PLEWA|nr:hypothetical protein NDU88_009661 [Pleurodeles waltl]